MSKRIEFNTWTDVYAFINLQCELEDSSFTRFDYAALMLLNERETADLLAEVPNGASTYRRINAAIYRVFSKRALRPLAHDVRALGASLIDAACALSPQTFKACMGLDDFIQPDSDSLSANSKVAAALAKSRAVAAALVKPGYELETIYDLSDVSNGASVAPSYAFGHQQARKAGFKFGAMQPSAQRGNRRS